MATNSGENIVKGVHLFTIGGSTSWYSHYGNQYGGSSYSTPRHIPKGLPNSLGTAL